MPRDMYDFHIYVVHATQLTERKQHVMNFMKLLSQHPRIQARVNFVTHWDPKEITQDHIKTMVNLNRSTDSNDRWDPHVRNMHINQVSNAFKHLRCIEQISQKVSASKQDIYLVIEDDVCFAKNIADTLADLCDQLPTDYDAVFLGFPGDTNPNDRSVFQFRPVAPTFAILPSCESYIISPAAAKKMLARFAPVRFSATKQIAFTAEATNTNLQYCMPNIFSDGSKIGRFVSTQTPNNRLMYSQDYVRAFSLLQSADSQDDTAWDTATRDLERSPIADHPDVIHLLARICVRKGEYRKAQEHFRKGDAVYQGSGAIINGESEFLRDYIDNFRNLQDDIEVSA